MRTYFGGAIILGFFLGMVLFNRLVRGWYDKNAVVVEREKLVPEWEFTAEKPWWVRLHQHLGQY